MKTLSIAGKVVPQMGQGTWNMGDTPAQRSRELEALRRGIELGMTAIDTAEMYGNGRSESLVGEAITGLRDHVTLISKVLPSNACVTGVVKSCEASLKRLGTDRLDLYLLHWRGRFPLEETVEGFERLLVQGKIQSWGVSNFDVDDMEELWTIPGGAACAANQILYNPEYRGPEFDLLPWCQKHKVTVMAYSPVGQGGELLQSPALRSVGEKHRATPAQAALAWCMRQPVLAIPKAGSVEHVEANAAAAQLKLTDDDLAEIENAYPAPKRKRPLATL